jgi:hypothetical protein
MLLCVARSGNWFWSQFHSGNLLRCSKVTGYRWNSRRRTLSFRLRRMRKAVFLLMDFSAPREICGVARRADVDSAAGLRRCWRGARFPPAGGAHGARTGLAGSPGRQTAQDEPVRSRSPPVPNLPGGNGCLRSPELPRTSDRRCSGFPHMVGMAGAADTLWQRLSSTVVDYPNFRDEQPLVEDSCAPQSTALRRQPSGQRVCAVRHLMHAAFAMTCGTWHPSVRH